jgi:hypothetical protein
MAIGTGHSKTVTDGLIFGYDTGDKRNIFKGQPGTNIAAGPNRNYNGYSLSTYSNGKLFESNGYTETVDIPTLGLRQVESVEIYNVYSGYGTDGNFNCCPSLFNYAGGQEFAGGTTYTYQIIYKTTSGYTHPNFMYHYEYGPSGYITEYGVHTEGQREHLGDGWYHAWATFTTNAATTSGNKGLWYYQYNVRDKVSVAAVSIVPGTTIRPPLQFIDENTTRSNTQGLLDISRTYSIDLTNMSFDSNGDLTFDATNDVIDTNFGVNNSLSQVTMEAIVFDTKNNSGYRAIIQNNVASDDALYIHPNNTLGFWPCTTTYLTVPANTWAYVAYSYDGTTMRFSVNGAQHAFTGTCADCLDFDFLRIGGHSTGDGERFGGKIAVAKVYNRALSEQELDENFRHYASRYGIRPVERYYEGADATNFIGNWNNSTTYYMAQFGGLGAVTAHGFTSGPVNYTLTLGNLKPHSRIRYKVKWHMVDSLDTETSRLFVGDGSSEGEFLTFTKTYSAAPNVSYISSPGTTSWSGHQTYSYRPWAGGTYGADGYLNIDTGWINHTSNTLTVRHAMGADQAQADEAMYLSHVEVLIAS